MLVTDAVARTSMFTLYNVTLSSILVLADAVGRYVVWEDVDFLKELYII